MTEKRPEPRLTGIVLSDGLDTYDPIEYDAKNAPNTSEHDVFRKYYEAEFLKILKDRDSFVEGILKEYSTGPLSIEGLAELLATAPEPALHYAAKYMLHRKLVDCFKGRGQELSAAREFYLLGATWAEARFMVNYRGHAQHGRASATKLGPGRQQRNAEAKHEARRHYENWQRLAAEIWADHQTWSKAEVARHVKKRDPDIEQAAETIAKKITRPR